MRPLVAWTAYLSVVLLGGALVAPWQYWMAAAVGGLGEPLATLARYPFHRFVSRSLLILALIGLWPLLRCLGTRNFSELGVTSPRGQWRRLGFGFLLGLLSLACIACLSLAFGVRSIRPEVGAGDLSRAVGLALLSGMAVGIIEEFLFRGAMLGSLRKDTGWKLALVISSMVYAWVHFLRPVRWTGDVEWSSGLVLLARMSEGLVDPAKLLPGFLNLALAGAILGLAFVRTGNLYFSVGLHAGWVFWLKTYGFVTCATSAGNPGIWGTEKLVDGWVALPFLAVLAWFAAKSSLLGAGLPGKDGRS